MTDRDWPHWEQWEQWEHGWDVIHGELCFEGESIEPMLPPHLNIEEQPDFDGRTPIGPSVDPRTDARDWLVRFPFENGWEAIVYPEWGVALNPAAVCGINRRYLGPRPWPLGPNFDWDNRSIAWHEDEMETLEGSNPYLDDPDHLVRCLAAIAQLPSSR